MKWRQRIQLFAVRTKFKILSTISKKKAARAAFDLFCTPPGRHLPPLPALYQEAVQIELEWNGFRIRGFCWNQGAPRRALIVHGFQSSSVNFEAHVRALTGAGMQVFAFDAPAHGGSSGNRVNVKIYAAFLEHIAGYTGPLQAVLAHSLGGLAICLALEQWPHTTLPRLCLIAPLTSTRTTIDQYFNMIAVHDKEVRREFEQIIMDIASHDIDWFSLDRVLPELDTPVLWIHDEDDDITPFRDVAPVWARLLPQVQYLPTKGLGHRRIYRDQTVIETSTTFLTTS